MKRAAGMNIDASKLYYSGTGTGVILKLRSGCDINFTAIEFQLYQNLFKICDSSNIGSLQVDSSFVFDLVTRTSVSSSDILSIAAYVIKNTDPKMRDNNEDIKPLSLSVHQWYNFSFFLVQFSNLT